MKRTVVGVITVVTVSSVFLLAGLGIASAAIGSPPDVQAAPAVTAFSAQSEAQTLQGLRDALRSNYQDNDATAMKTTTDQLATELSGLHGMSASSAMSPDTMRLASLAMRQTSELRQKLAALGRSSAAAPADLPLPGLGSLTALIH